MKILPNSVKNDLTFDTNADANKELWRIISGKAELIKLGGGKKAIERHKAKGKLTARERIDFLIDEGTYFLEIGLFAAHEMYE
jgi:acetyl-CoA carboxylase carboxyltransferase component